MLKTMLAFFPFPTEIIRIGPIGDSTPPYLKAILHPSLIEPEERCLLHDKAMLQHSTSRRGWAYITCSEKLYPYWVEANQVAMVPRLCDSNCTMKWSLDSGRVFVTNHYEWVSTRTQIRDTWDAPIRVPSSSSSGTINHGWVHARRPRAPGQLPATQSIWPVPKNQRWKLDQQLAIRELRVHNLKHNKKGG